MQQDRAMTKAEWGVRSYEDDRRRSRMPRVATSGSLSTARSRRAKPALIAVRRGATGPASFHQARAQSLTWSADEPHRRTAWSPCDNERFETSARSQGVAYRRRVIRSRDRPKSRYGGRTRPFARLQAPGREPPPTGVDSDGPKDAVNWSISPARLQRCAR